MTEIAESNQHRQPSGSSAGAGDTGLLIDTIQGMQAMLQPLDARPLRLYVTASATHFNLDYNVLLPAGPVCLRPTAAADILAMAVLMPLLLAARFLFTALGPCLFSAFCAWAFTITWTHCPHPFGVRAILVRKAPERTVLAFDDCGSSVPGKAV